MNSSGIESHNSLGIEELYHYAFRNTLRKLQVANQNVSDTTRLALSVKALNDTLGPEGIVSSPLVFRVYPSLRAFGRQAKPKKTLAGRAIIAKEARLEIERRMARLRVNRALKHNVPRTAETVFQISQKVLVCRENFVANRIGE